MKPDKPIPPAGRCRSCGGVLASSEERAAWRCWLCALVARLYPPQYTHN